MKKFTKILSLLLALTLCLSFPVAASARSVDDPRDGVLIDEDALGSLTLYKYDLTNAEKDGVWDSSYVSTGVYDETGVNNVLGGATQSDLGNGEVSYGYAIKGVEFSYLKIADIVQFTESEADARTDNHVEVLYGIDKVKGADFLKALGLENGAKRYTNADHLNANQYFYQSDVLIDALAAGLEANSTVVKNTLEKYMAANGGVAMPLTDSYGKTSASDLVVVDPERSENTICLAVSPSLKAKGVSNRCRVKEIPKHLKYITAVPRMQLYIDCAAAIHGVFLKYIAPEDIHTYSIDESFLYVTPYLKLYNMTARELAKTIIDDVRNTVGTVSTCGIGTNLYLAKIALDIHAKHAADFIAELDEESYREKLWDHKPITDFWHIASGKAERLRNHGITTMRDIAMMKEDFLYDWFGIDAELLIDHAWGREPTTIADIKAYRSKGKSLSSGQVLMRDYRYEEGLVIVKEMIDQLCLDMVAKKLATESVSLYVGYSYTKCIGGAKGTAKLTCETNADTIIIPAIATLYRRIVNPAYAIRRICLCCNSVVEDRGVYQLNMFDDISSQLRSRAIQETMLGIKAKYGKNAILKGVNYDPAATGRERNLQIGGHKSNG